ncbi:hypothetical protein HELRODRAFT_176111 [Helobdella robusta]|uniref:Uncharacterized protein n=1 Tax=Helobdella robusta TaxID=6412 RepID=T1FA53_HELRO|nr:hypothetical protein HELRODRAFT_176111 [Helobdella robusta]ESO00253.1 hypothetical protein HELRODRAFT_176111 [Helobdella robusta]
MIKVCLVRKIEKLNYRLKKKKRSTPVCCFQKMIFSSDYPQTQGYIHCLIRLSVIPRYVRSNYCKNTGNILKLILPIAVLLLAIIEFVVILLSWYKCKELSDNEYQYIGSTYTVYETYEPVYEKKNLVSTLETTPVHDSCCNGSQPVVIVNQQPISQQPVLPMIMPSRPVVKVPVPIKIPVKIPFSGRPPVKFKSFVSQQRYYPSQVYGPNFGKSPNTYGKMYLPPPGTYHVNSAYTAFNI